MIEDVLIQLLKENGVYVESLDKSIFEKPLTGEGIALSPVEMYRFLMCVENRFHIYFTAAEIEQQKM